MSQNTGTVLFTWEIGQGFGHVLPLLPIARQLKSKGHTVIFALRNVCGLGALLQGEGFVVLQAPTHPSRYSPYTGAQPRTMTDILALFGFASERDLRALSGAWKALFKLITPDLVIASYAPLSLITAHRAGIPTLLLALPFELPPALHPLPDLRTGRSPVNSDLDQQVIEAVNDVFEGGAITAVHQIFRATQQVVMSFPELDAFGPRTGMSYSGNLFVTDIGAPVQWPKSVGTGTRKIFAYLYGSTRFHLDFSQKLKATEHSYCVSLRDASREATQAWAAPNISVVSCPVRLDQALRECDAAIGHGGAGFVSASLMAGKPLLLLPPQLETYLTSQQVAKLGAAVVFDPHNLGEIAQALSQVLEKDAYRETAEKFARKYGDHTSAKVANGIVFRIEKLLENRDSLQA